MHARVGRFDQLRFEVMQGLKHAIHVFKPAFGRKEFFHPTAKNH